MPDRLEDASEDALLQLARLLRDGGYHFVTPTPATHARVNARPSNQRARSVADVFGWSRPFREGVLPGPVLEAAERAGVLARVPPQAGESGPAWRSLVRLSSLEGELFLHSAYPTAGADAVFFGPDTYRFAQAILAGIAGRSRPGGRAVRRAVDIGCGAGPGAVLVARAYPQAEVLGVDINPAALRLARVNAALAGKPNLRPVRSDLLHGVDGQFDLIVSNPPYLNDPAERAYRHGGGALGAALSLAILDAAVKRLAPGGSLVLYTGAAVVNGKDPFRAEAEPIVKASALRWSYRELDPDVFGEELDHAAYAEADRIAVVLITANKPEE